ncbi:nitrous oxide reductase family maturation protein NosD [Desulfosporosinus meridiei]|uniref:Parallel beta-helix repeat (Two copies) n=1 Tax=Desulfosporosinus meridiei (strain ATCC BAA-275 / DSM 13257 / KCTC 12902 / NCIMB 13706 / S10) TaxID=768704 RepID=J7IUC7_DESMD|nr:nitrous oxide reductase family maturation protein NosD [Desulfosporosinus meridiei]AFQ45305.1 parallel beta-helix repeat (two copies) [Desulfosporosinus meridiei DSM 13257]
MGKQREGFQGKYNGWIVGVLLLLVLWAKPVQAQTIEVSPTGPISSITEAIAKAAPGDEITVHPGVYQGPLLIDKRVKLMGLNYPEIEGGGKGDAITIKADGVTFQGFEVRGSGRKLENSDAGIKIFSRGNIVKDNHILDNLFGIYLNKASQNILEGNLIQGRPIKEKLEENEAENDQYSGLHPAFEGDGGDGIHLFAAPENKVINNIIQDTRDGIYFNYAEGNELIGNRISNVRYGIHYMYSNENTFLENILINNVAGAALMFSKDITFRNNVFAHSRGHRSYGLLFATCDDSLAEGNIIMDNTRGAFFDVSLHNEFRNNLVASNDVGLDLISSSTDNLFVGNNLIDNLQQVAMIAGLVGDGNAFFKDGQGNYWNDYRGFDLDRNGIGDIPYLSGDPFTYLMKKAPAVRLFLNSPAATALEFSERMFSIINIPKVKDQYPYAEPVPLPLPNLAEEFTAPRSSNKVLGLYSIVMLAVAGLVCYRVFRISSHTQEMTGFRKKRGN